MVGNTTEMVANSTEMVANSTEMVANSTEMVDSSRKESALATLFTKTRLASEDKKNLLTREGCHSERGCRWDCVVFESYPVKHRCFCGCVGIPLYQDIETDIEEGY